MCRLPDLATRVLQSRTGSAGPEPPSAGNRLEVTQSYTAKSRENPKEISIHNKPCGLKSWNVSKKQPPLKPPEILTSFTMEVECDNPVLADCEDQEITFVEEIPNSNFAAGKSFRPTLTGTDHHMYTIKIVVLLKCEYFENKLFPLFNSY